MKKMYLFLFVGIFLGMMTLNAQSPNYLNSKNKQSKAPHKLPSSKPVQIKKGGYPVDLVSAGSDATLEWDFGDPFDPNNPNYNKRK